MLPPPNKAENARTLPWDPGGGVLSMNPLTFDAQCPMGFGTGTGVPDFPPYSAAG